MNYFSNLIKNIDKVIIGVVVLLAGLSILMIGSTQISSGFISREVVVQCIAYFIGFIGVVIILNFNYNMFAGMEKYLYVLSLLLLLSVYIPGLGMEQFGARSWINLRVTTIQPSEFVKLLFILIM